jgi:Ca2+-binding RTX toxin-like protein
MKTSKMLRANIGLETLEERATPANFVWNGDLYIVGTAASDTASVSQVGPWYKVVDNGAISWYHQNQVWGGDIHFYGYAGNDAMYNFANSLRLNAYGHAGDDVLVGAALNDRLDGGDGSDRLYGYSGNDVLLGGNGRDFLFGMTGNDVLNGGDDGAVDYMNGGAGNDWFQRDWFWNGFFWVNRDAPADFGFGDAMYG